jgi:PBP1b-binding outer membrane lipoprotein LpoB
MMADLRAEIAIRAAGMILAAAALFAGCSEEAEREPEPPSAASFPIQTEQPSPPSEPEPIPGPERRLQHWRAWWQHAREVLFRDIQLSAEQAQRVDAVIAGELDRAADVQQRTAELTAARKSRDSTRADAARAALGASRAKLKQSHEIYEELRALLTAEQRPAFDMNRARLVAESQAPAQEPETQAD